MFDRVDCALLKYLISAMTQPASQLATTLDQVEDSIYSTVYCMLVDIALQEEKNHNFTIVLKDVPAAAFDATKRAHILAQEALRPMENFWNLAKSAFTEALAAAESHRQSGLKNVRIEITDIVIGITEDGDGYRVNFDNQWRVIGTAA